MTVSTKESRRARAGVWNPESHRPANHKLAGNPGKPEPRQGDPEESVSMNKTSAWTVALEDRKLLTESQVLDDEVAAGADSRANCAEEARKDGSHPVMMLQVGSRSSIVRRERRQRVWPYLPPSAHEVIPMGF